MLDLKLFRDRNFAVGNTATAAIYAGLSASRSSCSVFLQQVARVLRHRRRLALLPVTVFDVRVVARRRDASPANTGRAGS